MLYGLVGDPPGEANKKDRSEKQEIAAQKNNTFPPKKTYFYNSIGAL